MAARMSAAKVQRFRKRGLVDMVDGPIYNLNGLSAVPSAIPGGWQALYNSATQWSMAPMFV